MRVVVAGGCPALRPQVARALLDRGHRPLLLRSLRRFGVAGSAGLAVDLLDRALLARVLADARPGAVVVLPGATAPWHLRRPADAVALDNLLWAADQAGAARAVVCSSVFAYGFADRGARSYADALDESAPLQAVGGRSVLDAAACAWRARELKAGAAGATVLRLGVLHGPDVPSTTRLLAALRLRVPVLPGGGGGILPFVHVQDAAVAVAAAVNVAAAGGVLNIADDRPLEFAAYAAAASYEVGLPRPRAVPWPIAHAAAPGPATVLGRTRLRVSTGAAARDLGWRPAHRTHCGFTGGIQVPPPPALVLARG